MRVRLLGTSVVVGALLIAGCRPASDWQGTIEEVDGVVHVTNPREGLWQGRDPVPIRFDLEQTFGVDREPEEEILGVVGWHGVAVDGGSNVYVYDYTVNQIISFASDGSLRWRAGGTGQGPGEMFDAEGLAWDGDSSIWLTNASRSRLDQWSTDGEFVAAHALRDRGLPIGTLLGFLDSRTVALQSSLSGRLPGRRAGGVLEILDLSEPWKEVADVEVDLVGHALEQDYGLSAEMFAGCGHVTVGDYDDYTIRFFNRDGGLVRVVTRDLEEMIGFPEGASDRVYSGLEAALCLPTGHWLATARWVDVPDPAQDWAMRHARGTLNEVPWRSSLDLFDPDGRFLYGLEAAGSWPSIGYLRTVGPDGKLYTSVSDPFPQVRRYRVEIDR